MVISASEYAKTCAENSFATTPSATRDVVFPTRDPTK